MTSNRNLRIRSNRPQWTSLEHQQPVSMLIRSIKQLLKLTKPSHSSIAKILDGRLMFASFQKIIKTMGLIVKPKRRPKTWLSSMSQPILTLMRAEKDLSSVRKEVKLSFKPCLVFRNGTKTTVRLMRFQTKWSLKNLIWEALKALTSPTLLEIKVHVVHATQYLSHRLSSQDSNKNMARKYQFYHLNSWWCVTTWTRDVMEVGPSSMDFWPRTGTWYLRNAPHILQKLKVTAAKTTQNASQLQKLSKATSSEVLTASHQRRKWWRRSFVMVSSMASLTFQESSLSTRRVFSQMIMKPKCLPISNTVDLLSIISKSSKWLVLSRRRTSLIATWKITELLGWTSITLSSSLDGVLTRRLVPSTGS